MDYVAAVRRDASAIFELCSRDGARPIPSCPGWTAADLQGHILDTLRGEIPDLDDGTGGGAADLERALELLGTDPGPARGIAIECAVHRWDAASAFGVDYSIEPDLAGDGIDEFFEAAWPLWLEYHRKAAGSGETLRLEQSDGSTAWTIVLAHRPVVRHDGGRGDVTVSGSASDLLLWLWGRMDPPDVSGDRGALESIRNPSCRFLSPGF